MVPINPPSSCSDYSPQAESGGRTCPRSSSYVHRCLFQDAADDVEDQHGQQLIARSHIHTVTINCPVQFQLHLIQFVTGNEGNMEV